MICLAKYLDGEEISVAELEAALHEGVDAATVWPVLVGSGLAGIGVDRLLEFICHVGPAPNDLSGVDVEAAGDLVTVSCDPAAKPLAHIFKTLTDDYVGQLSLFKVLSGSIKIDDHARQSPYGQVGTDAQPPPRRRHEPHRRDRGRRR